MINRRTVTLGLMSASALSSCGGGGQTSSSGSSSSSSVAISSLTHWQSALSRAQTQLFRARIGFIGDSETMGLGAYTDGYVNARGSAYPALIAGLFRAEGQHASSESVFGNSNAVVSSDPAADYMAYNPAVTVGGGWMLNQGTSIGGSFFQNATTTEALKYTFSAPTNTVEIYYADNVGSETVTVNDNPLATITGGGSSVMKKMTTTFDLKSGNTLGIRRSSGTSTIVGMVAYDATSGGVDCLNMGWSGSGIFDWINKKSVLDPDYAGNLETLNLDLVVIMLGVNDIRNDVPIADYVSGVSSIVDRVLGFGASVFVVTPIPFKETIKTLETQSSYVSALITACSARNVSVCNVFNAFGSFAVGSAKGLYIDDIHPGPAGYKLLSQTVFDGIK